MSGSPSRDAAERSSRKRRVSQPLPEKNKKATTSGSPSRAGTPSSKVTRTGPGGTKAPTNPESSTAGASASDEKPKMTVAVGSFTVKGGKPNKAIKNNPDKAPVKDKKNNNNKGRGIAKEVEVKEEKTDTKDGKAEATEKKPDSKDQSNKGSEAPKTNQGVKLHDLEKAMLSNSEDSTEGDSDDSDEDPCSDDSDVSSESDDSEDSSHDSDYLVGDLDDASDLDFDELPELTPEHMAIEKEKTLQKVKAFVDVTKDKHYHEFHLETLTGPDNYIEWLVGLEVLLRMHQVWCVVGELCVPLDMNHEMYPWYEHMLSVAVSLIYSHVSQEIRSQRCFMSAVMKRTPNSMMQHIWAHFGQQDDTESHPDSD